MKQQSKNLGYGNGGKTNCVFPPFPQPLLLEIKIKSRQTKNKTRSFTQNI
jgi:hypothetical protein